LLLVVAIIAVLVALIAPAFNAIGKGLQLTQAGQMVSDQLGLARQAALSTSYPVEVRIYQFSDPEVPGETAGNANGGKYRAIQSFEMVPTASGSSTYTALTKMQRLPSTIIMDPGPALSDIIGNPQTAPNMPAFANASAPPLNNLSIPRAGTSYNACYFHFLADGSTDLNLTANSGNWFLTMRDVNDTAPTPKNFFTVEIDPYNGHIKTYRP
jgi:uncharacterized protein (TIGR02596 family)